MVQQANSGGSFRDRSTLVMLIQQSLQIAKMSSRLILQKCLARGQLNERCSRALSVGCAQFASKETKPEKIGVYCPDKLSSVEAYEHSKLPTYITITEAGDVATTSGVPDEHIKNRTVRIFQPAKSAMQSGTDNINFWQIDFETRERWENHLMGWSSTGDPLSNLKVEFATMGEAIAHCEKMQWKYYVQKPNVHDVKPRSYGANFSWDKRTRVTTK